MSTKLMFSREAQALALVALSGIMYGSLGYFGTQIINADLSVVCMSFWRFLIAVFAIRFLRIALKGSNLASNERRQYLAAAINGSIFYGLSSLLYFYSSQRIGTGIAMVLFYFYPVCVALLSWKFEGKKLTRMTVIAFILVLTGLVLVSGIQDVRIDFIGLIWAIISAVLYSLYIFKSKREINLLGPLTSTEAVCVGSVISAFVFCIVTSTFKIPVHLGVWASIVAMGTLSTAFPILFLLKGMKYVGATEAAVLSSLEPIATVIVGVFFLKEIVNPLQWLGVFVVLIGAGIAQNRKS